MIVALMFAATLSTSSAQDVESAGTREIGILFLPDILTRPR